MAQASSMGLDLSLTSTGVAVVSKTGSYSSSHLERIRTKPEHWAKDFAGRDARIDYVVEETIRVFKAFNPQVVVVEAPSYGSRFGAAHDRSGLWWRVVHEMLAYGPVGFAPPQSRAKYATGKGNADKAAVTAAAKETYTWLVKEWPTGKVDDLADGLVLAGMGMRKLGSPVESGLADVRVAAMDGVEWCGL